MDDNKIYFHCDDCRDYNRYFSTKPDFIRRGFIFYDLKSAINHQIETGHKITLISEKNIE